jgi:putative membrane protein
VRHPLVHAAQHTSFVAIGMLVWWPALEPKRRRLRGELWKIGHVLAARFLGMFLGMSFVLIRVPVYADVYGTGDRALGLSAIGDQQLAGGMMVFLDIIIMVFALGFFFLRAGQEHDRTERRDAALISR